MRRPEPGHCIMRYWDRGWRGDVYAISLGLMAAARMDSKDCSARNAPKRTVNAFSIDERAMLAALIDNEELAVLRHNRSMLARHARIGDDQIAIHLPPHRVRRVIQRQRLLLAPLHVDRDGKDAGDSGM